MKRLMVVLGFLTFSQAHGQSQESSRAHWAALFSDSEFQSRLDQLTGSSRSLNQVQLLDTGREAWPERKKALREAQRYIFQTVPFWLNDEAGATTIQILRNQLRTKSSLQFRLVVDWTSPVMSIDPFRLMQFSDLEMLPKTKVSYWNSPFWNVPWASELLKNRIHEKLLIIDGKKLFIGGMNVGNGYFYGGTSEKGWHDTEALVQGPIVKKAAELSLKLQLLIEHLKSGAWKPTTERNLLNTLMGWLNPLRAREAAKINIKKMGLSERWATESQILRGQEPVSIDAAKSSYARMIYTNSLFELRPGAASIEEGFTRRTVMFDLLELLLAQAQSRVRISIPYMSLTDRMTELFIGAARRGVRVQILTNSEESNDLDHSYYAGLSLYPRLIKAGVEIYEWQGHDKLNDLQGERGCHIFYWPGRTLHSKVLLIDESVTLVGSHNFNIRSEFYNSETALLVEGNELNSRAQKIFDRDLRTVSQRRLNCKTGSVAEPLPARRISLKQAEAWVLENEEKIRVARKILDYL